MSDKQEFNCVFCNATFQDKEEFQEHFRKHADPTYKNRSEADNPTDEKSKEKAEMVSCDVCTQVFPTISKAITHKHKMHPDHDAKYFCPWCGKLFTMKHLYNVHVQSSHKDEERIEGRSFPCDSCNVVFHLPSAMMNHNKFFHRQDLDLSEVGHSKKYRLYNQETIYIYYCAFCGEEYENKVNLSKHILDDHSDENQNPEEVLKCPLCEAVFYHLDAYEIHLTFHTPDDTYSVTNMEYADIVDYSLETVPPLIEKVENLETEDGNTEPDAETTMNAVGIEKFLELAMDQTGTESNPVKVKKRKKHKKSKKAAITLDEFLSMNQDVFGEGLDFQGIEEVPTRVVKKQLKSSKKPVNAVASAELDKLKRAGIVIKKKVSHNPVVKNFKIASNATVLPNKLMNKTNPGQELKTSSDVLTKLMNQSNSQIRIVKKVNPDKTTNEIKEIAKDVPSDACKTSIKNSNDLPENIITEETKTNVSSLKNEHDDDISQNSPTNIETTDATGKQSPNEKEEGDVNMDKIPKIPKETSSNENSIAANGNNNSNSDQSQHVDKIYEDAENQDHNDNDSDQEFDESENKSPASDLKTKIDEAGEKIDNYPNKGVNMSKTDSLSSLKHLSHLITVKPVSQNKSISAEATSVNEVKSQNVSNNPASDADLPSPIKRNIVEKSPNINAIKSLSKNITIKSLSTNRNIEEDMESEFEDEEAMSPTNIRLKDVSNNKNLVVKKIKVENSEPRLDVTNNNSKNSQENTPVPGELLVNKPVSMKPCKNIVEKDDNISQKSNADNLKRLPNITTKTNVEKEENNSSTSPADILKRFPNITTKTVVEKNDNMAQTSNKDILKRLPNITTKPVEKDDYNSPTSNADILKRFPNITTKTISNKPNVSSSPKQNIPNKIDKPQEKKQEIIEIFDIDDSDDENEQIAKPPQPSPNSNKSMDALKNLSKNVTIKSLKQESVQKNVKLKTNIKLEKPDDDNTNRDDSHSDEGVTKTQSKNAAFKNILQGLSKNITVKSRNSSPSLSVKCEENLDIHDQDEPKVTEDNDESDTDSCLGRVKISEVDDDISDSEMQDSNASPIVEAPNDSDNEEFNEPEDFESEIKVSTVQKSNQQLTVNTACLDNLRNLSKNLTVKPVNKGSTDKNTQKPTQIEPETSHNQTVQSPLKVAKQVRTENNLNLKKINQTATPQLLNKKMCATNQTNTINKEVTVKTIQTKTMIQEITTTVTKTVKTINQTVQQEVKNSCQTNASTVMQRVQGMGPVTQTRNLKGVVIRQASPQNSVKINNPPQQNSIRVRNPPPQKPQIRPSGTLVVRPSNSQQLIPVRPNFNFARPSTPRMPVGKKLPSPQNNSKPATGKPLKISPGAMTTAIAKRPNTDEVSGPFSCFKKPKESLIPVSDIPMMAPSGAESCAQYSSASHTSNTFTSTTKMMKGNAVVTANVMKSEVTANCHQSIKIGNATAVKTMSSQVKQTQVQEKSENSAMKRTTIEAIQKLQKQGLLIKKPRVEAQEGSGESDQGADDNIGYDSADEPDE